MFTRKSSWRWATLLIIGVVSLAEGQALTPAEIKSPQLRELQERYFQQLQAVSTEIQGHIFPYPFYFSRVLDLSLAQQQRADQRSLRFDNFRGMTVIELTGNYFGAYSTELVSKSHRALRTFQDVMLPILQITVPAFVDNQDVEGYAMEISHHIRGKAMGQNVEHAENLVLSLSKDAAQRLVAAKSENDRQAALLDGQFFINGESFMLYLTDQAAQEAAKQLDKSDGKTRDAGKASAASASSATSHATPRYSAPATPPRDTSPEALAKIQAGDQKIIDMVSRELAPQAHFVSYAPPAIVAFRKAAYLEFSVNTRLSGAHPGSRYKMAALAFDDHISHLVRPMMAYFKGDLDFDGIAFSTAIHQGDKPDVTQSEAVEFFFPVDALRCYEAYDCTGQQLIDQSAILINGERIGLDLQMAEAEER